jgi:hypothetical protein
MPPIEIPGLKEEIEKPGGSLPNLQNLAPHDLRWFAAIHEFKRRHISP